MTIEFGGVVVELLADKGVFLPASHSLVIGDVHVGKLTDFRQSGVAIPPGIMFNNLKRIQKLIEQKSPDSVYFLGDLFHAYTNKEFDLMAQLIAENSQIHFELIRGNHEKMVDEAYERLGLQVCQNLVLEGIRLSHHPDENSEVALMAGHTHPKVKLTGTGRESMSLPAFTIQNKCLTLPAFGDLTGGFYVDTELMDEIYVIGGQKVFRMK